MTEPLRNLDRYRDLVDDFAAFAAASVAPLPRVAWANPYRITPAGLAARLAAAGADPVPIPWVDGVFRVNAGARVGLSFEFKTGLCHVQEEVSLVPPVLLAARPGDRVLDTCAAPGGKAARIALAVGPTGTVVANDRSARRLAAVKSLVERIGLTNVVATLGNAAGLPRRFGAFDRVLADVPCSAEGTSRKSPGVLTRFPIEDRDRLTSLQTDILHRAFRVCRPGGRIVYSTCTYAPEENEAVVDAVLARAEGCLAMIDASVPGLDASPGVTEWAGRRFDPSLRRASRFWPHANDTGGFFVAVMEKAIDAGAPSDPPDPPPAGADDDDALERLRARFGIDTSPLEGHVLFRANRRVTWVVPAAIAPPPRSDVEFMGLPLFDHRGRDPALTTSAARWLGPSASRQVVVLQGEEAGAYLARGTIRLDPLRAASLAPGAALVRIDGWTVGTARIERDEAGARLRSRFPTNLAAEPDARSTPLRSPEDEELPTR